jgi:hypothetical protein
VDYFKIVLENLLPFIFLLATPILLLLAKRLVKYLEEKLHFDMSDAQEAKLNEVLTGAIAFSEEKALQALKTDPATLPDGAKKLDAALEFAMAEIKRLGLDVLAAQKLKDLIEAKLFAERKHGEIPDSLKGDIVVPKDWVDKTRAQLGMPPKG